MADDAIPDRLSQISTLWTALRRAHGGGDDDDDRRLLAGLIERYHTAAYRYLVATARNPDVAADLFQEFAVRFLRGDFRRASPDRGRFRDYLRTVLLNLVRARPFARPAAELDPNRLPAADVANTADDVFLAHWRKTLLDCAWESLQTTEQAGGPPYYTALRARGEQPDVPSADLAAWLTNRLKPSEPFTDAGVRKLLQRGRELLTDLLVAEVAASVPTRDRERLAQELIDLGFFAYCRKALDRWGQ